MAGKAITGMERRLREAITPSPAALSDKQPEPDRAGFDPAAPHPARIYNYWLGGKDHYPPDRQVAEEVAACRPQVVAGARANRAFLARAVRYMAGRQGIRQFIDIGPGLPAPQATHQVGQAIAPETRVVYVDNDRLVLVHARALLTSSLEGVCECVDADLRDPKTIIAEAAHTLDFSQPVGLLLVAVLHFLPDADDPQGIVADLSKSLVPGSAVAISHLTADAAPDEVGAGVAAYNDLVPTGLTTRGHAEVTALFGGLALVPPGVVPVSEWRPDHSPLHAVSPDVYAGVAKIARRRFR